MFLCFVDVYLNVVVEVCIGVEDFGIDLCFGVCVGGVGDVDWVEDVGGFEVFDDDFD